MLQQTEGRALTTPPGLDWGLADTLAGRLNGDVATFTALATASKQAHWSVAGTRFAELHRLFDELAGEVRTYIDDVAERAVTLGGVAHGTVQAAVERSALAPFPVAERDETRLLWQLARR